MSASSLTLRLWLAFVSPLSIFTVVWLVIRHGRGKTFATNADQEARRYLVEQRHFLRLVTRRSIGRDILQACVVRFVKDASARVRDLASVLLWVNETVFPLTCTLLTLVYGCCSITIGYHRLYSHRAFRAALIVRIVLAALGSMAFQGSIKVRLFARLTFNFTDSH
jgi:hypothetical protein